MDLLDAEGHAFDRLECELVLRGDAPDFPWGETTAFTLPKGSRLTVYATSVRAIPNGGDFHNVFFRSSVGSGDGQVQLACDTMKSTTRVRVSDVAKLFDAVLEIPRSPPGQGPRT